MTRDKDRLYVCLFARSGPGYHWSLQKGPKHDGNAAYTFYHAKNKAELNEHGELQDVWKYETFTINAAATRSMLVRVLVAKLVDPARVHGICSGTPLPVPDTDVRNCREWVRAAIRAMRKDGATLGTSVVDWDTIQDEAVAYVERKKADGRWSDTSKVLLDVKKPPTWDLIGKREIFP